jgi:hypothetical protein
MNLAKPQKKPRSKRVAHDEPRELAGYLVVKAGALAALVLLACMVLAELTALRGEVAFARFYLIRRLTEDMDAPAQLAAAVAQGSSEANLVMRYDRDNPDALWLVALACLGWAEREDLDPIVRWVLVEKAVGAAALAVRGAPTDHVNWLQLARALGSAQLNRQALLCLQRAQELAPPGSVLRPPPAEF